MAAPCLMVQGTASDVGKSVLVTALCRIFARAGYRVAPFKSQNMSLNAAATADGGEIGRAQAAQAEAAGIEPTVDMNPILLKPEPGGRSQLVVRGVARASVGFADYRAMAPALLEVVRESLARLRTTHDLVLIEGAGSPAEINFHDTEIVNMRVARLADAPVLLVGDIERGGVLAAFVGTLALLDEGDRGRIAGLVVNRLRGDPALLAPGLAQLTARTGVPVLGVIPALACVPAAEDSLGLGRLVRAAAGPAAVRVAVARLPCVANFDDFEPLAEEPGVEVRLATRPWDVAGADLVVLPGSKSTIADLDWLRGSGLADAIVAHAAAGGAVLGVCGGYQMLGQSISDPDRVESAVGSTAGLGLLPVRTVFGRGKTTVRVRARLQARGPFAGAAGVTVDGYEIHAGRTMPAPGTQAVLTVIERACVPCSEPDGALVGDGAVAGTYVHGLLANGAARRALLTWLARRAGRAAVPAWGALPPPATRYDELADAVAAHLDLAAVARLVGLPL